MTLEQIIEALDKGQLVNCSSEAYMVHWVESTREHQHKHWTNKDGQVLRVTCRANYFGSLMSESDLSNCFIK